MVINITGYASRKISDFYAKQFISRFIIQRRNIKTEIENSFTNRQYGVITSTPMIKEWEENGYHQLYCKKSGWFFAYRPIAGGIQIHDAYHQYNIADYSKTSFNSKQNLSLLTTASWKYIRDAGYGFGIIKNLNNNRYNYSDLNGCLLVKDENNNPIWFDNVGAFYDVVYDERLSATAILNGYIVWIRSDGTYLTTNTPASKYNLNNKSILEQKINTRIKLKESQLRCIINETIKRILRA